MTASGVDARAVELDARTVWHPSRDVVTVTDVIAVPSRGGVVVVEETPAGRAAR